MASYIRTLKNNNDLLAPRTYASLVKYDGTNNNIKSIIDSMFIYANLTLKSDEWNDTTKSQTVSVSSVTETNTIIVSVSPEYINEYSNAGIICTEQTTGHLTFTYIDKPTENISVNVMIMSEDTEETEVVDRTAYLTFSSPNEFSISINRGFNGDGTLEYSFDTENWDEWNGERRISGKTIYLRGTNVTTFNVVDNDSEVDHCFVITESEVSCSGNIENILDYQTVLNGNHPVMADYCFEKLFNDCDALISVPDLPSPVLSNGCYKRMFRNCTSLTSIPSNLLPATELKPECYRRMFGGCESLTNVVKIPAMVMAEQCCEDMYRYCYALTTIPNNMLPATTLAENCYSGMFYGCSSLAEIPSGLLPATTLAENCYSDMFGECTSLVTVPTNLLPAITLADYCYTGMFGSCTALTSTPNLQATIMKPYCYQYMFYECTSLTTISKLPAMVLDTNCYNNMFSNCTNVKLSTTHDSEYTTSYKIPSVGTGTDASDALTDMFIGTGGTFTGTPTINTTYYTVNNVV